MKTLEEVFVENLKRLRGQRSQASVAEAAGIPLRSYQHVEGGSIPQIPNRQAIAKALGVVETALFLDADLTMTPAAEAIAERAAEKAFVKFVELQRFQNQPTAEPTPIEALRRLFPHAPAAVLTRLIDADDGRWKLVARVLEIARMPGGDTAIRSALDRFRGK